MAKLHILNTDHPIHAGETIVANCGKEVRNVKQCFIWDETLVGEMITSWPIGTCRQCANLSDRQIKGRHFIYGLQSGTAEIEL